MKYIQCPHCDKKYTASEKLCAAAGKNIRCKHCRQIFKIVIHDDNIVVEQEDLPLAEEHTAVAIEPVTPAADDAASPGEQAGQEALPESNNEPEKSTKPVKKKSNIHLLISIILAFALLAAVTVTYLFFYKPELFGHAQQPASQPIIPHNLVNPIKIDLRHPQSAKTSGHQPDKQALSGHSALPSADGNHTLQACKATAAEYWLRTRLLATASLDTDIYMKLLDMNLKQADKIRRICRNKALVGKISEAARRGIKPAWIKDEIELQMAAQFNVGPKPQKTSAPPTDHP